ncbi:MAG: succinylglutamate desuccinylase, partial [Planctomycetes bacterium]|nr:succinylglutamate desuccinylase [Planctomycetota bacterium]
DEEPWQVVARVDGILIAQMWASRIQRGQHIALVGRLVR